MIDKRRNASKMGERRTDRSTKSTPRSDDDDDNNKSSQPAKPRNEDNVLMEDLKRNRIRFWKTLTVATN